MGTKVLITAIAFAGVLAGVCGSGCGQKKGYERGTVGNGVYANGFFGFTMDIPEGMYVMPDERTKTHGDGLSELMLFISAFDPADNGSGRGFNYNIAVTSEKLPASSRIGNNGQYAAEAVRRLEASSGAGPGGVEVGYTALGGREFVKFGLTDGAVRQDIYARYHDGYALIITCSYADESGRARIDDILATVRVS